MIDKQTLTIEWIDKVSKANRNTDKILIEKVIRALILLEGLSNSGLAFTFKGGTALMLLLDSAKRLSIDIDIVISKIPKNLNAILNDVASNQSFNRCEEQHRSINSDIAKAHYKFFYSPIFKTHDGEDYILLDIIFEQDHYSKISAKEITSKFVMATGENAKINFPSFEDLLGDKLTAFAPNTTGIPYFRNENSMSMEIMKQLFDIGNLVDVVEDIEIIKSTFEKIGETEIQYRKLNKITLIDVLNDIYQTSLFISVRGHEGKEEFGHLQKGIQSLNGFIFSENYQIEKAIIHASKAAYIARLIATNQKQIEKFINPEQVLDSIIEIPHNQKLNKLKKTNPEAFFYWWKATQLI